MWLLQTSSNNNNHVCSFHLLLITPHGSPPPLQLLDLRARHLRTAAQGGAERGVEPVFVQPEALDIRGVGVIRRPAEERIARDDHGRPELHRATL